ncbi:MAG: hypothetical protein A3C47_05160 [Omnitrophica bacterium RIFCSPHIGHO2_02_FULL_51_18]|nr:MAG: hypothetical protein A3C47_05160 [Omnitrophica bacterium RIFCSPHIGHO2_02_FULL_51_18]
MKNRWLLFCLAISFWAAPAISAVENNDCFSCHEEGEAHLAKFKQSAHTDLSCTDCHDDLAAAGEFPHDTPLKPVNCGSCHEGEQKEFSDSLHGKALERGDPLAPRCQNCHGNHNILPVTDKNSQVAPLRIPFVCGSCHSEGARVQQQREIHQDHILENYSESIHGEGLFKKGLSVSATCISCHSAHHILPHTDPRSSIARGNIVQTCLKCHSQIEAVHRKVIKGELWEKSPQSIPICVECHQPHKVRKVFYDQGVADKDCLMCHAKQDITASADGRSLFVNGEELTDSAHTKTSCAQCHNEVTPSIERACATVKNKVNCAVCHTAQVEQYQESTHGKLHAKKDPNAPFCADCHGTHGILAKNDTQSRTFPTHVPALCAECHQETKKAAVRYRGAQHEIPEHYVESIHGKGLLKSGLVVTAMCTSCHTAHRELPASDPESSVNRNRIASTCAACHKGVYEKYRQSIHAPAKGRDADKLPVCSDCHTAHTIKRTDMDAFKFEIMNICGKCHLKISETYFDTFHGKVTKLGYAKTAKCHDCHGAHEILPPADPRSTLSRHNIVSTCRKCHAGATKQFAGYLTHATHHDPHKYPLIFWTFWLMTALLVGTFAASGIHTLLWLPKSLQMRRARLPEPHDPSQKQYVRFTLLNRILHATMIVSFLTLATTGMTLKFSYTAWAIFVSRLLGGFEVSGFLHRSAAGVLVGLFLVHLWDLLRRKRLDFGSWKKMLLGPDTVLFTLKDVREFFATVRWYMGRGARPRYGRWTYWEKFDYFAVFWGIAIIGSSGLMLWFPEFFTHFLPGWMINVATIIHSDEALLAAGFIFTIHFFNTHFRPEKFPMDTVIFTGRMSVEELKRERPAEYEELVARNELEKHLADPLPPKVIRTIRIFAWIALLAGMSLVVGIIYAMLFAYK